MAAAADPSQPGSAPAEPPPPVSDRNDEADGADEIGAAASDDGSVDGEFSAAGSRVLPQSALDLARNVSAFLRKLEPWKHIMPSDLRHEMEDVIEEAGDCMESDRMIPRSPLRPPLIIHQRVPEWTTEIENKTMEDWRKTQNPEIVRPFPVLIPYYRSLGSTLPSRTMSMDFSGRPAGKPPRIVGDQKNLQRIWIMSMVLHDELELITSTSMEFPLIIAPPYKLLLEFLPQIRKRLDDLSVEMDQLNLQREGQEAMRPEEEANTTNVEDNIDGGDPSPSPSLDNAENAAYTMPTVEDMRRQRSHLRLETRISHLSCLIDFIDSNLGDLVDLRAQARDGTLDMIAFDDLWHLFKPGDLVVSKDRGREKLSTVYFVTGGQIQLRQPTRDERSPWRYRQDRNETSGVGTWTPFKIDTYGMAFDGNQIGPREDIKTIKHYMGKKLITELPVYPVQFHPTAAELLKRMEERGSKVMSSLGHMYYEGLTISKTADFALRGERRRARSISPSPTRDNSTTDYREDIVSDVYVDFEAYNERLDTWYRPKLGRLHTSRQDPTENSEYLNRSRRDEMIQHHGHEVDMKLTEDYMANHRMLLEPFKPGDVERIPAICLQLLSYEVPGYAFRYRQWYMLDIDVLQKVDQTRYLGFRDLVIPEHYKELLVALVDNHATGIQRRKEKLKKRMVGADNAQIDLVPGKGQGLIILLHGPPGSGKTSTAETIATYTGRPLYSITCGDIGLKPDEVELQLSQHATRADKWGCVLLLDEADVFLMQRNWKEMDRNALVSVFLRQLEYYSGILFLTTNRPGTIDEAFKSRIHVSLRYPGIDLHSTKQMWENIMRRIEAENEWAEIKVDFDRAKLFAFAEQHYRRRENTKTTWNGRQIRNAFQTALALGHADRLNAIREAGKTPEWAAASGKKKWMTVKLTVKNLQNIARTTNEFEDYIVQLRGKDSDAAREAEIRDDDYDPFLEPARKDYSALRGGRGWGPGVESLRQAQAPDVTARHPRGRKRETFVPEAVAEDDDTLEDDEDDIEDDDDDDDDDI